MLWRLALFVKSKVSTRDHSRKRLISGNLFDFNEEAESQEKTGRATAS
jgi:hypothetical protein